ncbi:hypothetical protein [Sphingomonas aracearum]|uniref:Acyltransferase 3 domain-containing protein n=1 Tax=Sphingomonas aracearum TaxID=2283317 RepID=A0A369VZQ2_9SPHN|nr:hypothetical protein [Sphingomonas aracearum]RDE05301.1 hypothetical protein DVW87_08520 [Sphingomonas aracearum]
MLQVQAAAGSERLPHGIDRLWPVAWSCFAIATILILLSVLFRRPIVRWISPSIGRMLRWMGLITYPLYLIHIHVGLPIATAVARGGGPVPAGIALGIAASIAAAAVVAIWLEPPLHRLVKKGLTLAFDQTRRAEGGE